MIRQALFLTLFCASFEAINSKPRHPVVVNIAPDGENFRAQIHVAGKPYHLNLQRPVESIFAPNFRFTETIQAPNGEITLVDLPVNISHIEQNTLEDPEAQAVFRMEEVDGEMRLHGIMENIHISHDGEEHYAVVHELPTPNTLPVPDFIKDYILVDEPLTFFNSSVETRQSGKVTASPEVFMSMDTALYEALGSQDDKVARYLQVLMKGVNNRYVTMNGADDPEIKMLVVGFNVFKTRPAQPFVESGKRGSKYDISPVLNGFAKYMKDNAKTFAKHDLAPLVSGENYGTTVGLAWTPGACKEDINGGISGKTSVSQDFGGVWAGIHTVAHELCHNLGGPHDADKSTGRGYQYDTTMCPWADGYIMSYEFNSKNRLTFSSCSRFYMKQYISSDQGSCLRSRQASSSWSESKYNPGEYVNYDKQCQNAEKGAGNSLYEKAKADWKKTPAELCAQLLCRWETGPRSTSSRPHSKLPLDGTSCNSGAGKCLEGKCV